MTSPVKNALEFCSQFGMDNPVFMAPMAGACPASLAIAVSNAGGMGACGTLLLQPDEIRNWMAAFRAGSNGPVQLNNWIPDAPAVRDRDNEQRVTEFLTGFGPVPEPEAGDRAGPAFDIQCRTMLDAKPNVISSIMGLYDPGFVKQMHAADIKWFVTVTTVAEALAAQAAGADAVVAQGMEAGGHRGAFDPANAETHLVGLFALLPAVVDAVRIPVIATGGIADARGSAAALTLGASGVQIGTGLLRSPEAGTNPAWADAISNARPEDTVPTRAFSGRLGRSIRSRYVSAANDSSTPEPAPYPIQRGLTQAMRDDATRTGDLDRMQAWAGQSAGLARAMPAGDIVTDVWNNTRKLLGE